MNPVGRNDADLAFNDKVHILGSLPVPDDELILRNNSEDQLFNDWSYYSTLFIVGQNIPIGNYIFEDNLPNVLSQTLR